jgi:hypothetical protein
MNKYVYVPASSTIVHSDTIPLEESLVPDGTLISHPKHGLYEQQEARGVTSSHHQLYCDKGMPRGSGPVRFRLVNVSSYPEDRTSLGYLRDLSEP